MVEPPREPSRKDDISDDDDDDDSEVTTVSAASLRPSSIANAGATPLSAYEEKLKQLYASGKMTLDNPIIPPRPGKYGLAGVSKAKRISTIPDVIPDDQLVQNMTDSQRDENLKSMRQLRKDMTLLLRAEDSLGFSQAESEFERCKASDPWYRLNERLYEAFRCGSEDDQVYLKTLVENTGGPPPLLKKVGNHPRGYALIEEIYDIPINLDRIQGYIQEQEWKADAKNMEQWGKDKYFKLDSAAQNRKNKETTKEEIAQLQEEKYKRWIKALMMDDAERMQTAQNWQEREEKEREDKAKALFDGNVPEIEDRDLLYGDINYATKEGFAKVLAKEASIFDDVDNIGLGIESADSSGDGLALEGGADAGDADRPLSKAAKARAEAMKNDGSGRPRLPGDIDVTRGDLDPDLDVNESSSSTTGPLTVEVSSTYNSENSDPPMRKHCFQYTVRITNNSSTDTVQLLSRRFEIQTVGSAMKDVVQGEGVTGRQPVLQPGEVFEYTSTAPLSVRPIGTTEIAARMCGEYRYCILQEGQDKATEEQINKGQGEAGAELAVFHFVFPQEQRVKPVRPSDDDDDEEEDPKSNTVASKPKAAPAATDATPVAASPATSTPASSLPGEPDMISGNISITPNDSSDTVTSDVRVLVTSTYRPERSDSKLDKHCFAYNVRITNESKSNQCIQLVSRRFEIQTVGSANKDVVQGPGVTGRQPTLKPGESFEYTSTAPLSVRPMKDKTNVVARMSGEYNFVQLADDGVSPVSSTPLKAELGAFHFILPE